MRRSLLALAAVSSHVGMPSHGAPKLLEAMVGAGAFQNRVVALKAAPTEGQNMPPAIDRLPKALVLKGGSAVTVRLRCLKVYRSSPQGIGTSPSVEAYMSGPRSDDVTHFLGVVDRGAADRTAIGTSPSGGTCGAGNLALKPATVTAEGNASFTIEYTAVAAEDVRPYVPEEFKTYGTGGRTTLFAGAALFEDMVVDGRPVPDFQWSELLVVPSGDPGDALPGPWGYYIWRLSDQAEPLSGLAPVGLTCGNASTFMCHVPGLRVSRSAQGSHVTVAAEVPWRLSPYSMSATFSSLEVPIGFPDHHYWMRDARGLVRGDFHGLEHSSTAGLGTIRSHAGTPFFQMLGGRSVVTAPAQSWRFHFEASFTVEE